jgi:hypothetical protein
MAWRPRLCNRVAIGFPHNPRSFRPTPFACADIEQTKWIEEVRGHEPLAAWLPLKFTILHPAWHEPWHSPPVALTPETQKAARAAKETCVPLRPRRPPPSMCRSLAARRPKRMNSYSKDRTSSNSNRALRSVLAFSATARQPPRVRLRRSARRRRQDATRISGSVTTRMTTRAACASSDTDSSAGCRAPWPLV